MGESEEPPAGRLPKPASRSGGQARKRDLSFETDLYRVAYAESQRTLDDQQDELQGMRSRSVQFTAFVGAATAFLVGTGLHAADRNASFYALAAVASALSALSILLLIVLLNPSKKHQWEYRLSAESLINGWIETEVPVPSEAQFLRELALTYDVMRSANEVLLGSLRTWYRWLIITGSAQVTVWAALVWLKS